MAPRAYWKGYLKLSLVSCPVQLFPAISEREKIRYHQINRKTGNRIKYCKLDAVTDKPIRGAPPPITSERLQTGRTAPSIGSRSTAGRRSRSEPRARSPPVGARRAGLAGSWALRSPIRHQLDRSGNEGHSGPPQGGVQASTSGALQRIKRPAMNHIRFIGLKNFPDRLLTLKHRLPGMFPFKENVEAGGLTSAGADPHNLY